MRVLLFSSFLLSGGCSYKQNSAYFYFQNQLLITNNVNNVDVVDSQSRHLLLHWKWRGSFRTQLFSSCWIAAVSLYVWRALRVLKPTRQTLHLCNTNNSSNNEKNQVYLLCLVVALSLKFTNRYLVRKYVSSIFTYNLDDGSVALLLVKENVGDNDDEHNDWFDFQDGVWQFFSYILMMIS